MPEAKELSSGGGASHPRKTMDGECVRGFLASAWLEEANSDFQAGKILLESGFFSQSVFLSQQAAAKAFKAAFIHLKVAENTGLHPAIIFEDLLKKQEGVVLKPFETKLPRLLKAYRLLELEANSSRFPKEITDGLFCPRREYKALHSARSLTTAREIFGMCEQILRGLESVRK